MKIGLRKEDIKIMEQPKYRLNDLKLQSDIGYTDIKERVVGIVIDNRRIDVPFNIQRTFEGIINNMLADNYSKTQQVLYPKDFEVCISVEADTEANMIIIDTYIFDDYHLGLYTRTNANVLHGCNGIKKFFFDTLTWIESMRIANLRAEIG